MAYRIELSRSAVKELERLSVKIYDKIIQHLAALEQTDRINAYKLRPPKIKPLSLTSSNYIINL